MPRSAAAAWRVDDGTAKAGYDALMRTLPPWLVSAHLGFALIGPQAAAATPSFDCGRVGSGSIEAMVCGDESLSRLDRDLAHAYAAARAKAGNQHPPTLAAEQRGWIKGRNDCWKAADRRACAMDAYRERIAELQARYRLVEDNGVVRYACNGRPADELTVTYFATDPPSAIAERGDSVSMMFLRRADNGPRYVGRNEWLLQEHQDEVRVQWGYGTPEFRCEAQR